MIFISNINAIFLATVPIFGIYSFSNGFQLYWFLAAIICIINLFSGKISTAFLNRKLETVWFFQIIIIGFLGSLFNSSLYFDYSLFLNNFANICIFFVSLIICTNHCNTACFKKTLFIIGVLAAIICIYQRTQLLLTGSFDKQFFIPGLVLNRDLESFTNSRVSAFFTEPAHLSIYLLPIFYLFLNEKKSIGTLLTGAGILFSGSTTGFLLLAALILVYMLKVHASKKSIGIIMITIVILYFCMLVYFPEVLLDNVDKLNNTDSDSNRFLGPLVYVNLFDFGQWFYGVGLNQLGNFLGKKGIIICNEWGIEKNANYANAIIFSFLSYGLLGFMALLMYFRKAIKHYKCELGFMVFVFGILLSDQVLFNRNLLYILVFLILSSTLTKEKGDTKRKLLRGNSTN